MCNSTQISSDYLEYGCKKLTSYVPEGYLYLDQKRKLGMIKLIQKHINKFGVADNDLNFATT